MTLGATKRAGFTMLEIMMAVLIIALLAAIAFPAFAKSRKKSAATAVANDLKVYGHAFDLYSMERGGYPPDCALPAPWHLPNAQMESYLNAKKWAAINPFGGNYEWEGKDVLSYAGIALVGPSVDSDSLTMTDEALDDGVLTTGLFRQTPNGRYTYVLDE